MPSTYTNLRYHVVFATKHRRPLIEPDLEEPLYRYIGGIILRNGGVLDSINGMADHVHILAGFRAAASVSRMLQEIKGGSSHWINNEKRCDEPFAWQEGYAAFTVSESQVPSVRRYIRHQKQHHRTIDFERELEGLLGRHGIALADRDFA